MTEDDLIQLNEAIEIIKTTCEHFDHCYDCPMKINCSLLNPSNWEAVKND